MRVSEALPVESRLPRFEGLAGWLNSPRRMRMLPDPGDSRLVSRTYAAKEDRSW